MVYPFAILAAPLVMQLPPNAPGKAEDPLSKWAMVPLVRVLDGVQVLVFGLVQPKSA